MRISPFLRNLGILALIALVIVVLNLESSLVTASMLLQVAFFIAIAFVAYMLWRDFGRREIELWPKRAQWVFYGAVGLLVVDLGWFFLGSLERPRRARVHPRRRRVRVRRDPHLARPAPLRLSRESATPRRGRRRRRGGRAPRGSCIIWPTKIGVSRSV